MGRIGRGLAGALCLASLPSLAVTSAEVRIGAPLIRVVDLDLRDGIAAAYEEGGPYDDSFVQMLGAAPGGPFTEGRARITRDEPDGIAGRTGRAGSTFYAVGDRYAPSYTFTVTPHSRVTVSTDYRLQAGVAGERRATNPDDAARAQASLELALVAVNNLRADDDGFLAYDVLAERVGEASLFASAGRSFAQGPQRRDGTLTLSFDNRSDSDAVFAFRAQMVAFGISPQRFEAPALIGVTPVPEPETYALMLAGLGLLGWRVRRARQAKVSAQIVRAQFQA